MYQAVSITCICRYMRERVGRRLIRLVIALSPQQIQEELKLNQLKDRMWYVAPSCATTGEGLFEGLVSLMVFQ